MLRIKPWFARPQKHSFNSVVIIGGGLAGLASAYALAKHGVHTTLIEKADDIAKGTSENAAGLLMPLLSKKGSLEAEFYERGFQFTRSCIITLQNAGYDISAHLNGLLYFTDKVKIANHTVSKKEASCLAGIEILQAGLYLADAGFVSLPSLCQALKSACAEYLTLIRGTEVTEICRENDSWQLQTNQSNSHVADVVVIANAEGLNQFKLTEALPIKRVPGQLNYIKADAKLKIPICAESYVLPAHNGEHVLGASFRQDSKNLAICKEDYLANLAQLKIISPNLAKDLAAKPWQGRVAIRATTIDHLPMIGPVADSTLFKKTYERIKHGDQRFLYREAKYYPGLYVNVGHGARGLSGALLAGEILASLICNSALPVANEIYQAVHPSRFFLRELKRAK